MDTDMADVLDEAERSSIRGTLMQLAQQSNQKASQQFKVDAYMRECNIWVKPGMTRSKVKEMMKKKLGLESPEVNNGGATLLFDTPGSNTIRAIEGVFQGSGDQLLSCRFQQDE